MKCSVLVKPETVLVNQISVFVFSGEVQDSILEELYLVHDVGHSIKDFKRGLDDRIGIEPGMFDRYPLERGIGDD